MTSPIPPTTTLAVRPHYGRWFLALQALAWTVLGSWYLAPTRAAWDWLDASFFLAVNGTLGWGSAWQVAWAVASHRAFDLAAALCFIGLFVHYALAATGQLRLERLCRGGVTCAWAALTLAILARVMEVERLSPSLVVDGAIRLSELVPYIKLKDVSGNSFPGDHGTAVLIFTTLGWVLMSTRTGLLALATSAFFVMPRLVSGGHWLSDLAVGSVFCAGVSLSLALGTPTARWLVRRCTHFLTPLWLRFPLLHGA